MAEEHEKTEFNSNLATLERVDKLLRFCSDYHAEEDYISYFKQIRNLRKEIIVKMRGDKYKVVREKELKDFDDLCKCFILYRNNPSDFGLNLRFDKLLIAYEQSLRDFADLKGMLLKDGVDDGGL